MTHDLRFDLAVFGPHEFSALKTGLTGSLGFSYTVGACERGRAWEHALAILFGSIPQRDAVAWKHMRFPLLEEWP